MYVRADVWVREQCLWLKKLVPDRHVWATSPEGRVDSRRALSGSPSSSSTQLPWSCVSAVHVNERPVAFWLTVLCLLHNILAPHRDCNYKTKSQLSDSRGKPHCSCAACSSWLNIERNLASSWLMTTILYLKMSQENWEFEIQVVSGLRM